MYKIVKVEFVKFYSDLVTEEVLERYLMGAICNYKGQVILELSNGFKFKQEGPYILPPIRWLDSFESTAEFKIICDAVKVS